MPSLHVVIGAIVWRLGCLYEPVGSIFGGFSSSSLSGDCTLEKLLLTPFSSFSH